ncbi:hypothetical protein C8R48DRAFT_739238 [Suillus tomentosus]|nr:hypothetical protein C8R48DRAFT_739238 [Suillus tomentosus]
MRDRGKQLKEQLNELGHHRKKYYECNANATAPSWASRAHLRLKAALLGSGRCAFIITVERGNSGPLISVPAETGYSITTGDEGTSERKTMSPIPASSAGDSTQVTSLKNNRSTPSTKANGNIPLTKNSMSFTSLQDYQSAKKDLKKAVVEYYRYVPFASPVFGIIVLLSCGEDRLTRDSMCWQFGSLVPAYFCFLLITTCQ